MPQSLTPRTRAARFRPFSRRRGGRRRRSSAGRGRLIFALDATMSRQPTWDLALALQGRMFEAAAERRRPRRATRLFPRAGRMPRLAFRRRRARPRRPDARHFRARRGDADRRACSRMRATRRRPRKVGALVFVGDAMEESAGELFAVAGELALRGVKAFMFQEGGDPARAAPFRRSRADRRRLRRLRRRRRGPARDAAARGGGLCCWRAVGAGGAGRERGGRPAAARADARLNEVGYRPRRVNKMVQFIAGLLALYLLLAGSGSSAG